MAVSVAVFQTTQRQIPKYINADIQGRERERKNFKP
jgi:hypothetical protein